jgi:hypothetical protein
MKTPHLNLSSGRVSAIVNQPTVRSDQSSFSVNLIILQAWSNNTSEWAMYICIDFGASNIALFSGTGSKGNWNIGTGSTHYLPLALIIAFLVARILVLPAFYSTFFNSDLKRVILVLLLLNSFSILFNLLSDFRRSLRVAYNSVTFWYYPFSIVLARIPVYFFFRIVLFWYFI